MTNLMCAEIGQVTDQMRNDNLGVVISDTGLFFVTTKDNVSNYPEEDFFGVTEEGYRAYPEIDAKLSKLK